MFLPFKVEGLKDREVGEERGAKNITEARLILVLYFGWLQKSVCMKSGGRLLVLGEKVAR